MKTETKIVRFEEKIPTEFSLIACDEVASHSHPFPQLLILLSGKGKISIEGAIYTMRPLDLVLINAKEFHALEGDMVLLSLLLDLKGFGATDMMRFRLNSMAEPGNPRYAKLRNTLFSMVKYNTMENVNSLFTNRAIAFSFFSQLVNDFEVKGEEGRRKVGIIPTLVSYLDEHYAENLTLGMLSEKFGYALPYIARRFKEETGKSFLDYYDELRVSFSMDLLLNTQTPIEEIASLSGYPSPRSYVRAFQKIYGKNPSAMRKTSTGKAKFEEGYQKKALDIILGELDSSSKSENLTRASSLSIDIDLSRRFQKAANNPGNKILTIHGPAPLFFNNILPEIRRLKEELGYTILHVDGVYANQMPFLIRGENGEIHMNKGVFQTLIGTILGTGLYPYLSFHYDPSLWDLSSYRRLTEEVITFLFERYEKEKLHHWKVQFTADALDEEFFEAVDALISFTKRNCKIKVVSPLFSVDDLRDGGRYSSFHPTLNVDFLSFRVLYSGDRLPLSENLYQKGIEEASKASKGRGVGLILEDANYSKGFGNLLNDTVFASSFFSQLELESYGKLYAFTSPFYFGGHLWEKGRALFCGDPSPIERGWKKASYHAIALSSRLGKEFHRFAKEGIITRTSKGYAILLTNFLPYSDLYAKEAYYELSRTERYRCFPSGNVFHYYLRLKNLPCRKISVRTTSLGRDSGSSFDTYIALGAPEDLSFEEAETLKGLSEMRFFKETKESRNGEFTLDFTLAPLETKLIEIAVK
ncbi:MAG: AraC family transcriptional regulator [Candidatus Enteromonas sp.]|nr:AraC family transcriptional regulator [Candidatus Enteromonas sp.]